MPVRERGILNKIWDVLLSSFGGGVEQPALLQRQQDAP